jgi:hypothetical protein
MNNRFTKAKYILNFIRRSYKGVDSGANSGGFATPLRS